MLYCATDLRCFSCLQDAVGMMHGEGEAPRVGAV